MIVIASLKPRICIIVQYGTSCFHEISHEAFALIHTAINISRKYTRKLHGKCHTRALSIQFQAFPLYKHTSELAQNAMDTLPTHRRYAQRNTSCCKRCAMTSICLYHYIVPLHNLGASCYVKNACGSLQNCIYIPLRLMRLKCHVPCLDNILLCTRIDADKTHNVEEHVLVRIIVTKDLYVYMRLMRNSVK